MDGGQMMGRAQRGGVPQGGVGGALGFTVLAGGTVFFQPPRAPRDRRDMFVDYMVALQSCREDYGFMMS